MQLIDVARNDLQYVVKIARNQIAGNNFRNVVHETLELIEFHPGMITERHIDVSDHWFTKLLVIQNGGIAFYYATIFQSFQTGKTGGGGQADPVCEIDDPNSGVTLQLPKDLVVAPVERLIVSINH